MRLKIINIQSYIKLLLILSLFGSTTAQDDDIIDGDTTQSTTVNLDELYDQANDYYASIYDWEEDQPNVYPKFSDKFDFNFGYSGGTKAANNIYKEGLTEEQKAVVFPLGIRGIDKFGRKTSNVCMGTLVHKEILMTICACVNSWYRSYRNLGLQEATSERFKVSDTSDEQFDIRSPTLIAQRSTWDGYKNKTGEQEFFPISRLTMESPWCTKAVEASNDADILNQYKTVVFLQLTITVEHPVASTPGGLAVAQLVSPGKELYPQIREKFKYDAFSYFQYAKANYEGAHLKAEAVPKDAKRKISDPDGAVDLTRQLMSVTLQERLYKEKEAVWERNKERKGPCAYNAYEKFANIYKSCPSGSDGCPKDLPEYVETLVSKVQYSEKWDTMLNSEEVACFEKKSSVHLCGLAPGTPIMHDFEVFGITMATNSTCQDKQYHVFVLRFNTETSPVGAEMSRAVQQAVATLEARKKKILESLNNPLPLVNRSGGGFVDISGNLDAEVAGALDKGIAFLGLVPPSQKPAEEPEEFFIYADTKSTATRINLKLPLTLWLRMLVEVSVLLVLIRRIFS